MSETGLKVHFTPTDKQWDALDALQDQQTTELVFGGGAGGGKSYLGCYWAIKMCLNYPGVRGFIGRNRQVDLFDTTWETFKTVAGILGLQEKIHYLVRFKPTWSVTFFNDSRIIFKDLFYKPSDEEFTSLGSLELTFAYIDEAGEITEKARNILLSRIRHETLTKYDLHPKLLMTCNPAKGFLYQQFFDPARKKTLAPERAFIQSLLGDNEHITKSYRAVLESLDLSSKQRLLYGNWDFTDDPSDLIEYSRINDLPTNTFVPASIHRYITADLAFYGADRFVLMVWEGWKVTHVYVFDKADPKDIEQFIRDKCYEHRVPMSNVTYDADGLGTYLRGYMKNAVAFVNNSKPKGQPKKRTEKYNNLKSQCYFFLARKIQNNEVWFAADIEVQFWDMLKEELSMVKNASFGTDKPLAVMAKDKIKVLIGRSPDFSDCMAMRSVFDVRPAKRTAGRAN